MPIRGTLMPINKPIAPTVFNAPRENNQERGIPYLVIFSITLCQENVDYSSPSRFSRPRAAAT